jgi:hypothetical protein
MPRIDRETLTYAELVDQGTRRILFPERIPVHPLVYRSDFAYTPEFVTKVRESVPESIAQDVGTIEPLLGLQLGVFLMDGVPAHGGEPIDQDALTFRADPNKRFVEVGYLSTNIALDTREGFSRVLSPHSHPIAAEKLRRYSLTPEDEHSPNIPTWYIHNLGDNGLLVAMYLRNFAIMFNNLGLEQLPN